MELHSSWWWVRHAPVGCDPSLIYGSMDLDADCSDGASFQGLAALLPRRALWITSSLIRTQQTAQALAAAGCDGDDFAVEPDFSEICFGDWEGHHWHTLNTTAASDAVHKFWLTPAATRPPNGESFVDLIGRVGGAVERWQQKSRGRDVVVIAHGGTIRAMVAHKLGIAPDLALGYASDNLALSRLDCYTGSGLGGDWRMVYWNLPPKPDLVRPGPADA